MSWLSQILKKTARNILTRNSVCVGRDVLWPFFVYGGGLFIYLRCCWKCVVAIIKRVLKKAHFQAHFFETVFRVVEHAPWSTSFQGRIKLLFISCFRNCLASKTCIVTESSRYADLFQSQSAMPKLGFCRFGCRLCAASFTYKAVGIV